MKVNEYDPKIGGEMTLREALSWMKVTNVHVEIDSLIVIQAMRRCIREDSSYFNSINLNYSTIIKNLESKSKSPVYIDFCYDLTFIFSSH